MADFIFLLIVKNDTQREMIHTIHKSVTDHLKEITLKESKNAVLVWEVLCVTVVPRPAQHTHTPQVQNMPPNSDHTHNKHN